MKLIYVAQLSSNHDRDKLWVESFRKLDLDLTTFSTCDYQNRNSITIFRIANRLQLGANIRRLRQDLVELVRKENPDWVHFRLPLQFDKKCLCSIKKEGAIITSFYNDDPFSPKRVWALHHLFIKNIPIYDVHFLYRNKNIKEFLSYGAQKVFHCFPYFVPWIHKYSFKENLEVARDIDAAFIGHWENDGRIEYIEAVIRAGYRVVVKGPLWKNAIEGRVSFNPASVDPVFGSEYNNIYGNATAGLCFFSKINCDTWTRRALEIVSVGGLLVCERTKEAESHFIDRKEAFFFSSITELLDIMDILMKNPVEAKKVREAGYRRLINSNHSIMDRTQEMLNMVRDLRNNRYSKVL